MLTKFSVSNFKGFNTEFVFDLQNTNNYTFNSQSIKNGIVNNALIYGHNGVGKSNLGLAIFDVINHLTDKESNEQEYSNYLNAVNSSAAATFRYELIINSQKVIYEYQKTAPKIILAEKFSIDGKELAFIDRTSNEDATINFKGAENLKRTIYNKDLSLLKYIKNNSELDQNKENTTFLAFFSFINKMLFFRSLQNNIYLGLNTGRSNILEDIIKEDKVADLEQFLNKAEIECQLTVLEKFEGKILAFYFENGKKIPFAQIASQGTLSLTLFYYWLQKIKKESTVSFLFIDEFDAFYHHELSSFIVSELKKTGVQFVLTTHNTSIITNDLLRPDCYFLMNKKTIKSLAKATKKELREAHNIEKMYKAGTFYV